ncbi:PREDICTED: mavicyanin-like [Lupinus angustifolius]|uniref:mavicyanin-like n=1 Tax=Lupinus angustifolius TaxID=3871 RepID=UPI00092F76EA|nr:PREDICTED: mavicyanin-like [Lupinus angustifolius]
MSSSSSSMIFLLFLLLPIFSCLQHFSMASFDFQVGGTKGWIVPPPNDTNIYNDWASNNRFQLGDTIYFSYKKDSVMEVSERDYKECNATHPTFFSNIGNTVFKLEHSRTFYFISGASGHCEKGQKMILRVMVQDEHAKSYGYHDAITTYGVFGMVSFTLFWNVLIPL